ncbi:hypothetical protein P4H26_15155 [Paenibacillus larvae]|uniref:hypothetical protein n=1 Tax=Paenibacillus larvae TaxID=1464 RepID=UPI0018D0890C|nr:hypothetical protein [Paenibacillus larvae]MBH0340797.1 hypothetical protein [Paenibacillus larvae]MEC0087575.1 hypothetical protein [Paenibacillus larvae]MEC0186641.1 hypothetical protein [Paenibacillus larvae]
MNKSGVVYWRELKRQKHLCIVTSLQFLLTTLLLVWRMEDFTTFTYFLYIPFLFSVVTQNDIYFYDLTTSIGTLLATPLDAAQILKEKGLFVVIKSVILGVAIFPAYLIILYVNGYKPNILLWNEALLLLLCFLLQYSLSLLVGTVTWLYGKKSRLGIIIGQGLLLNGLTAISSWDIKGSGTVMVISIVAAYGVSRVLIKRLRTEKMIMRCL